MGGYFACFVVVLYIYTYVYVSKRKCLNSLNEQSSFNKDYTLPIRGLCALFVVTGHLENFLNSSSLGTINWLHFFHWSTPAVSVFFFLSGYGLSKKLARIPIQNFKWISPSLKKIGISLLIFCFIYVVMYLILDKESCIALMERAFFNGTIEILPHSWYMYVLLLLYCFFWLCYKKINGKKALIALCMCILAYSYLIYIFKDNLPFGLWTKAIWSFPLGIWVCNNEYRIKEYVKKHFNVVYITIPCFILLLTAVAFFNKERFSELEFFIQYIILLNLVGFFVYIVCIYIKSNNNIFTKVLSYIGTISMEVYLAQGIFQKGLLYFLDNKYIYLILNYFLIIIFAAFMHKLLIKIGLFKSSK